MANNAVTPKLKPKYDRLTTRLGDAWFANADFCDIRLDCGVGVWRCGMAAG